MNESELHSWLKKLDTGDKQAFLIIYRQLNEQIYQTVYFLCTNKHDVDDIVSEVYMELFKSLGRYDYRSPFQAWLHGLIVRQVSNWSRKVWRKFRLFQRYKLLELEPATIQLEEQLLKNESNEELSSLVEHLSFKLKTVIVLRYYHDYSYEEIASILDIPLGTVKSRHHQAIQKLRQYAKKRFANFPQEKQEGSAQCYLKSN